MNYDIISTTPFERQLKKLAKKHKSLKEDIAPIINELEVNPALGTSVGYIVRKFQNEIVSKFNFQSGRFNHLH